MRISVRVLFMMLVLVLFFGCAKKAGIEGKVVDGKEKPMSGVKMIAKEVQPIKGYEHFETTTSSDGSFAFKGVFPSSEYVIRPSSDTWKTTEEVNATSGPKGQTALLDKPFVIRFTKNNAGVVADSKTGLQWAPSNGQDMNHYQAEGYVKNLNLDGGAWRLPMVAELKQIDPGHPFFNAVVGNPVWSGEFCPPGVRNIYWYLANSVCFPRDGSDDGNFRVLAVRSPK